MEIFLQVYQLLYNFLKHFPSWFMQKKTKPVHAGQGQVTTIKCTIDQSTICNDKLANILWREGKAGRKRRRDNYLNILLRKGRGNCFGTFRKPRRDSILPEIWIPDIAQPDSQWHHCVWRGDISRRLGDDDIQKTLCTLTVILNERMAAWRLNTFSHIFMEIKSCLPSPLRGSNENLVLLTAGLRLTVCD